MSELKDDPCPPEYRAWRDQLAKKDRIAVAARHWPPPPPVLLSDLIVGVQPMSEDEFRQRHPNIVKLKSRDGMRITYRFNWVFDTDETRYNRAMSVVNK